MTVTEILSLTPVQFYDLHTKGFFTVKQEKHPFLDDQQQRTAGSSDSSGFSSTQEQCPPSPQENDDFMRRINMDCKIDDPPNLMSSQKQATTFESDWIEQLDPRKTALELIKDTNIRKQLQDNGYQPIESDVRKSSRKRKPTSFYDASPSTGDKIIRKVSPESRHDSHGSIATSNDSLGETDDENSMDSDLKSSGMEEKESTNRDCLHSRSKTTSTKGTGASSKAKRGYTFEERYSNLQDFLRKTGHTRVPFKYPPNPSLGYWVASVRHNYKRLQKGLPLKMVLTWEQVDILSNMPGWVWCAKTVQSDV